MTKQIGGRGREVAQRLSGPRLDDGVISEAGKPGGWGGVRV